MPKIVKQIMIIYQFMTVRNKLTNKLNIFLYFNFFLFVPEIRCYQRQQIHSNCDQFATKRASVRRELPREATVEYI